MKDLLEAKELDNAQVDRGVESQATLVGAERGVELDAEAAVDLDFAIIVDPWHPKDELAFRLAQALHRAVVRVLRVFSRTIFSESRTSETAWWNSGSPALRLSNLS